MKHPKKERSVVVGSTGLFCLHGFLCTAVDFNKHLNRNIVSRLGTKFALYVFFASFLHAGAMNDGAPVNDLHVSPHSSLGFLHPPRATILALEVVGLPSEIGQFGEDEITESVDSGKSAVNERPKKPEEHPDKKRNKCSNHCGGTSDEHYWSMLETILGIPIGFTLWVAWLLYCPKSWKGWKKLFFRQNA